MKKASLFKILKNKNFLKLWGSQIFSQVSAYLLNFVLMVKIYETTGSTTALSLFLLVYTAPSIFLGLFAGAFIDHWSKRKVLLFTNLAQSLVVLLYLGAGETIWPLYTIVFLYSLCDEFFAPAEAASLPALVKAETLPVANSLFLFTNQCSILAGSLLGGPLVKYLSPRFPFILAFLFLLAGSCLAYLLPHDHPRQQNNGKTLEEQLQLLIKDVAESYRFIRKKPRVFYPFLFYIISQMLIGVCIILFPSLAREVLLIDIKDAGLVVLLPVGIGAILGSIYITKKIKSWGRKRLISLGWLIIGVCFLAIALIAPKICFVSQFVFLTLLLLGIGGVLVIITSLTMIQENTPEEIRGRVFGALSTLMIISSYLPIFFLATITDLFGVMITLLLIGMVALLTGIISLKVDRNYVLRNSHRT
ncbi:MAG TPA: MFS transporter [Candidatus Bathyarchaeia archaeon]|nr:MFS transporter [Candidatus Bathyarchaeia archaeon]